MIKTHSFDGLATMLIAIILAGCSGGRPSETSVDSTANTSQAPNQENTFTPSADEANYAKLSAALEAGDISNAESIISESKFNVGEYETTSHIASSPEGTLLFKFTASNNKPAIRFLLSHGIDPNIPAACIGEEGCDFAFAISCDHEVSDLLLKAGSKPELDYMVICSAKTKDLQGIRNWIKKGANPDGAITFAVTEFQTEFVMELVRGGANKDKILDQINGLEKDTTFSPVIKALVLQGAYVSLPLLYAIRNRNTVLTDFLLSKGANIDEALSYAVEYEQMDLAKKLILQGAHVKVASKVAYSDNEELKSLALPITNGKTYSLLGEGGEGVLEPSPLMVACSVGNSKAVDFMLKSGADPNIYCNDCGSNNPCDTSALGIAIKSGFDEIVELLKKYKAKVPEGCN